MKKKLVLKKGSTIKKVKVSAKDANIKQDLGGGFSRFVFFRSIAPFQYYVFTFFGGALKTVSGGWWIANNTSQQAYAISNYSQNDRDWIVVLYNPTAFTRSTAFTFIAKT